MFGIFYNCSSIKELDLSTFNTYRVINMIKMFYYYSNTLKKKIKAKYKNIKN